MPENERAHVCANLVNLPHLGNLAHLGGKVVQILLILKSWSASGGKITSNLANLEILVILVSSIC